MHDVAQTILAQLGGRRFLVMTGAKQFVGSATTLSFTLPATLHFVKNRIHVVRITLDPSDTYSMVFYRLMRGGYREIDQHDNLYAEDLQPCFTRVTGLETHL